MKPIDYDITEDGFGIHTFELTMPNLTKAEFEELLNKAKNEGRYNNRNSTYYPKRKGIRVYLNHTDNNFYIVKVIVTPRKLIDENSNEISILRCNDDFGKIKLMLNEFLADFFGEKYNMDSFNLSRVDFCVNIKLSNKKSAERYVKLIRRSMIYSDFAEIAAFSDDDAKEKNKHIFRITTGNYTFTAYDKYYQLDGIGKNYDEVSDSLLRLEIAVDRDYIREYIQVLSEDTEDGNISNNDLIGLFANISRGTFKNYICDHFYAGDYYCVKEMKSIIEKSKLKPKTVKQMINYAEIQSFKKSLKSAQCYFESTYKKKRLMKKFESIGVYPVSLSDRDKYGNNKVPGLRTILGF